MKSVAWREANDIAEGKRLQPGGYICRIVSAEDVPDKEYLKISYDIALGDYKDYWKETFDRFGTWNGNFYKSYKEKALPFFKGFMTAVEESNSGYIFNDDERTLTGKLVGLVIGEEEYRKQDGKIGKRFYVDAVRSVEAIKKGEFEVPELKTLTLSPTDVPESFVIDHTTDDDDLPF